MADGLSVLLEMRTCFAHDRHGSTAAWQRHGPLPCTTTAYARACRREGAQTYIYRGGDLLRLLQTAVYPNKAHVATISAMAMALADRATP